jgi:hypothetical protein
MIVTVASKLLKQAMEIFIEDEEWEKIKNIENKNELNHVLMQKAMKQISKFGYAIGRCDKEKKQVTLKQCLDCAISRGYNLSTNCFTTWDECKKENIDYQFVVNKPFKTQIKDHKIAEKVKPTVKADLNTFSVIDKPANNDEFGQAAERIMKPIKDKENL